jgi:hypothetical protein
MQLPGTPAKDLRYRAYYWLMDASTVAVIYSGFEPAAKHLFGFGIDQILPPLVITILIPIIAFFMLAVPMFLICARFMRDEYTEQLWKRTFVVLAYVVALLPFAYLIVYWSGTYALGHPKDPPLLLSWPELNMTMGTAVYATWIGYMILFVITFQFLRWKDSR